MLLGGNDADAALEWDATACSSDFVSYLMNPGAALHLVEKGPEEQIQIWFSPDEFCV